MAQPAETTHQMIVVRVLDAPPERVWDAWTRPEQFAAWFSTPPFKTPESSVSMDVRPGGEWRATQVSEEDGTELPFAGHYREVTRPVRLVLTFEDPATPENPDVELLTVELRPIDRKTQMTVTQVGHLPEEQYALLEQGYSAFFDQMDGFLGRA